jgi:hypothetical protein
MADALVSLLNRFGYQPIFLPRPGVVPPDVYTLERAQPGGKTRLVRRGALARYVRGLPALSPRSGGFPDIEHVQTSGKKGSAAASFLERALRCIGIESAPKLDLSFAGQTEMRFSLSEVTLQSVDPADLDAPLQGFKPEGISTEAIEEGWVHIAYEYAYAKRLVLERADKRELTAGVAGNLSHYIDLGLKGQFTTEGSTRIVFESSGTERAAFAYKAGYLQRAGSKWFFHPESVNLRSGEAPTQGGYVPARGVVLLAEPEAPTEP